MPGAGDLAPKPLPFSWAEREGAEPTAPGLPGEDYVSEPPVS